MELFKPDSRILFEDNIFFLKYYEPFQKRVNGFKRRNPKFDAFGRMILRLKENQACAVELFTTWLERVFAFASIPIAVVTSHSPDRLTGILNVARRIAAKREDATSCLIRIKPVPKQAYKGKRDRDEAIHLQTIKISHPEIIRNTSVLLLDDICTTGATLNACASLLLEAGAGKVIRFALGKTVVH